MLSRKFLLHSFFLIATIFLLLIWLGKINIDSFVFAQYPTNTPIPPTSTPIPTNTPTPTSTPTNTPTPTITPTSTITPTPTFYQIYGWVYTETNNSIVRAEESTEGLIPNYILNLTGAGTSSTTSQASAISGWLGNYIFTPLYNGTYSVSLAVTPTGSVLYSGYSNPQVAVIAGGNVFIDFPFVTVTPTPGSLTPTPTCSAVCFPTFTPTPSYFPTSTPTNTPGPSPTPTASVTPGGPSLTPTPTTVYPPTSTPLPTPTTILITLPASCETLPTPILTAPSHETCTNAKPGFSATVSNPNNDSAWAHFYSNAYETFSKIGSVQNPPGGSSTLAADASMLNYTGGYWWTAYTESPSCPKSIDAPARLINMDYSPPPEPQAPTCVYKSQSLITGICNFTCTWTADPETDGSCSGTDNYHPIFWNKSGSGGWDPGWIGDTLSIDVTTTDGEELLSQLAARDSVGNISSPSSISSAVTCPKLNFSPTITAGGPTLTPTATPTPTITPTPTVTLTPTPGAWLQVIGGDVYQKSVQQPLSSGKTFLVPISSPNNPSSSGTVLWKDLLDVGDINAAVSTNKWNVKISQGLSNTYSFQYYWEALKNKAKNIDKLIVGDSSDLTATDVIYYYGSYGYAQLSSAFVPKTKVTIFLISGSLEITKNFSIASDENVIFVVSGNILVDGTVTSIPGLYISSDRFSIASGASPITIDGMVYAKELSLNRTYKSYDNPAYQFIYQPKYFTALLPYLGRSSVNWQEVKP